MHYYLNGSITSESKISIHDRGFLLADGLFETLKIIDNQPEYLNEHLARMAAGAKVLGIPFELRAEQIIQAISELIALNRLDDQSLCARLTLTRGPGPRGLLPPADLQPTILLTIAPYSPPPDRPVILSLASNRRNEFSSLSTIKSLAYSDNVLGRLEAASQGADDCLFLNTRGLVACTSCANIFIVKNGVLITPPVSDGILPGIMRAQIIAQRGAIERSITLDECREAERILVCNSLMGMREAMVDF
jgi:branched-chain amino acid aminotransferase